MIVKNIYDSEFITIKFIALNFIYLDDKIKIYYVKILLIGVKLMKKIIKKILILMLGLAIGGAIAFYQFKGNDGNNILNKKDGSIDTSKADIKVEISGFDGYAKAKLSKKEIENLDVESFNDEYSTDDILDSLDVSVKADKKENLSNGDTITITMNFKNNSDLNIDINKKKLVKKVKVKGLEKIVNSLDDFDEDTLDRMNADANKILAEDYNDPKEGTNRSFYDGDKVNYEFTRINIFEKKLSEEEILEKNKFDNQKSYSIAMVYKVKFDEVKDTEYDSDSEKRIITKKEEKSKYVVFVFDKIQANNGGIIYSTNKSNVFDSEEKAINQVKYDGFELVDI